MSHDPDGEVRRRRDAQLRTQDQLMAEHLSQALRSGELQSAPSFGRPMEEAEGWAETPEEFRLPFKILRNAGIVPPEVEIFRQRARLRDELAQAPDEASRIALQQKLSELEQALALRLEGMRQSGKL